MLGSGSPFALIASDIKGGMWLGEALLVVLLTLPLSGRQGARGRSREMLAACTLKGLVRWKAPTTRATAG